MLVSYKSILDKAFEGGYGVGAFNCLSLEHVMGVVRAAERLDSPVILELAEVQFPYSPMELMAPMFLKAAHEAKVPVAVHLDHGLSPETCLRAIKLGFGSVMFDGAALPFEENVRISSEIVRVARAFGVDVEAELGRVGEVGKDEAGDIFTDVEEAAEFVERTGVDALAIAIGNLHGNYISTPQLNIERLRQIRGRTDTPLVLHGGSGTGEEDFKACVHNGIAKVNVATALQLAVTQKIKEYLDTCVKPNYIDMKWKMIEATEESAAYHMYLFESAGKA